MSTDGVRTRCRLACLPFRHGLRGARTDNQRSQEGATTRSLYGHAAGGFVEADGALSQSLSVCGSDFFQGGKRASTESDLNRNSRQPIPIRRRLRKSFRSFIASKERVVGEVGISGTAGLSRDRKSTRLNSSH